METVVNNLRENSHLDFICHVITETVELNI